MALGTYHIYVQSPCALDLDARRALGNAIAEKDERAMLGLIDRRKAVLLTKDTTFELASDENPWAWGFVRSGPETGRECYAVSALLK
jgi:hypothetical protein